MAWGILIGAAPKHVIGVELVSHNCDKMAGGLRETIAE